MFLLLLLFFLLLLNELILLLILLLNLSILFLLYLGDDAECEGLLSCLLLLPVLRHRLFGLFWFF
jgi:hypothetical protein